MSAQLEIFVHYISVFEQTLIGVAAILLWFGFFFRACRLIVGEHDNKFVAFHLLCGLTLSAIVYQYLTDGYICWYSVFGVSAIGVYFFKSDAEWRDGVPRRAKIKER